MEKLPSKKFIFLYINNSYIIKNGKKTRKTKKQKRTERKIRRSMKRERKGNFAREYLTGKFEVVHHPANSRKALAILKATSLATSS